VVQAAYDLLRKHYRTEYYFKNLIASSIFVGKHRAARSSAFLDELRIGQAVADCVLINGDGVVYEVKTEYDSPARLLHQLNEYYKAFAVVNVVVHESQRGAYEDALSDSPAGLITVGRRGSLSQARPPVRNDTCLNAKAILDVLRLAEAQQVLRDVCGHLPDVPNGVRYTTYLRLAQQADTRELQFHMQQALKSRALRNGTELLKDKELLPLRAVLTRLDPPLDAQENLRSWLRKDG
jgi:hypothetical protein